MSVMLVLTCWANVADYQTMQACILLFNSPFFVLAGLIGDSSQRSLISSKHFDGI